MFMRASFPIKRNFDEKDNSNSSYVLAVFGLGAK
ncbi:hypothetical protein SAMN06265350_101117 [Solitalea koreensis]|uniref:Uncharacterized protein n=1 Tax=Solitalea koreensis TaxID=543615 RepID=A0A521AFS7_9SPHI|nr:hypothetical protein SAMN06265350_101117 [Solitalea koreensis]